LREIPSPSVSVTSWRIALFVSGFLFAVVAFAMFVVLLGLNREEKRYRRRSVNRNAGNKGIFFDPRVQRSTERPPLDDHTGRLGAEDGADRTTVVHVARCAFS